jgi:hypothetical protein
VPQKCGAGFGPATFSTAGDGSRVLPLPLCKGRDLIGALPDCRERIKVSLGPTSVPLSTNPPASAIFCKVSRTIGS